jgi:hypothetical protein
MPNKDAAFQNVLSLDQIQVEERYCTDLSILNGYLEAYFINVHPLVPVLHKAAFLNLYKVYAPGAILDKVREIKDASSREGRAVGLICSVLALGAMSLVKPITDIVKQEKEDAMSRSRVEHYGEAMGFYKICGQLTVYAFDSFETMLTFLLMVVAGKHKLIVGCVCHTSYRLKGYSFPEALLSDQQKHIDDFITFKSKRWLSTCKRCLKAKNGSTALTRNFGRGCLRW